MRPAGTSKKYLLNLWIKADNIIKQWVFIREFEEKNKDLTLITGN